jgi:hypothetical protein
MPSVAFADLWETVKASKSWNEIVTSATSAAPQARNRQSVSKSKRRAVAAR